MTYTDDFDSSLRDLTTRRSEHYGSPSTNFRRTAALHQVIDECEDAEVKFALRMIAAKISRLIESPHHVDSVHDIAGYARCIAMIWDDREKAKLELTRQAQELEMGYEEPSVMAPSSWSPESMKHLCGESVQAQKFMGDPLTGFTWATPTTTIIESD